MPHLRAGGLLLILATAFASLGSFTVCAQQPPEIIFSYPPGALAVFPQSVKEHGIRKIYLRADGTDEVWSVDATPILIPVLTGDALREVQTAVGFIVPQIPKGRYVGWYQAPNQTARQSMKLDIVPQLLGDVGITRGSPGGDVAVGIRIFSPKIERRDAATPLLTKAEITLSSADPTIAGLAANQAPTISTNGEGIAIWRVHIHQPGIARFIAVAEGFEPTMVNVVGMPLAAPTFLEAAFLAAQERAVRLENAAQQASETAAKATDDLERDRAMARTAEEGATGAKSRRSLEARIDALKRDAVTRNAEAANALNEMRTLKTLLASQPGNIREADLKPGDILLVRGTTPLVSQSITKFESSELQSDAPYSHASIYIGSGQVAEMLMNGFYVSSLKESTKSDLLVDVYRLDGITDVKRAEIARHATLPYGPGIGSGSPVPYAVSQISVLAYIAAMRVPLLGVLLSDSDVKALISVADEFAGGRRKMICSELVAWIYRDAGFELDVSHWKRFRDLNVLTTEERRKDYTTPNMLARSKSLRRIGRYLGP